MGGGGEIRRWVREKFASSDEACSGREKRWGSLLLATVKGSGAEKGRERKKEEDSGYKKFLSQDSEMTQLLLHVSAVLRGNRSAWLPRVFTYPALVMRQKISNRALKQAYIH